MGLTTITADLPGNLHAEVSVDQVSVHFGIAPMLVTFDDDSVGYAEHHPFLLIHLLSGRPVSDGSQLLNLRQLALDLELVDVDWDQPDPGVDLSAEQFAQIRAAYARAEIDQPAAVITV